MCLCVYVTTHLTTLRERCVYRIVFYWTIINNNPQCLPLIHPAHSIHWIWHSSCIIPQLVHSAFRVSRFYFIFPTFEFMFCYFSFSCLFLVHHASGEMASTALFCHALIVVYIGKCLSICEAVESSDSPISRNSKMHSAWFAYNKNVKAKNNKQHLNHTHAWWRWSEIYKSMYASA